MKFSLYKTFNWIVPILSALLLTIAYVYGADTPKLETYVNDYANVLSLNDKHNLNEKLANFEKTSPGNAQIVVLIVPNLAGTDIETYSNDVFHNNKIGHKDNNNGVLTVIAMQEHKLRMEVGYDLEPTLTDNKSKEILTSMQPSMKSGNVAKALNDEMNQLFPIVSQGSSDHAPVTTSRQSSSTSNNKGILSMVFIIFLGLVGLGIYLYRKSRSTSNYNEKPDYTSYTEDPKSYVKNNYNYVPSSYPKYTSNTYDSPSKDSRSSVKSAVVGGVAGFAASELLNSRKKNEDNYSSSSNYDSSSSSNSSSSDSSFSGGGGDSGGGGSSSDW